MAPKKSVCHAFQRGNCRFKNCKFEHVKGPANPKTKVCEFHARGRCNRGKDCKWSHDADDIAEFNAQPRDPELEREKKNTETKLRQWKAKIPDDDETNPRKLGGNLGRFIQDAYELSTGEPGVMQEIITQLASAGGMMRIAELLDQEYKDLDQVRLESVFMRRLLPLFNMLARPEVNTSPILENRITTICNYVYGLQGLRVVKVFEGVQRYLQTLTLTLPGGEVHEENSTIFENSVAVLALVVRFNTPAQANEGLAPIVHALTTLQEAASSEAAVFALRTARKYLNELQQRLGLGEALPTADGKKSAQGSVPKFELQKDLPGALSVEGQRHDNDSDDICEISILPTLQEIQSSRNEYLPSADPQDWHIGGLEGLLDRNFRLLREDTVGVLRDAAKFELERLQHPDRQTDVQRKRQGARTNIYENVALVDIAFDPHAGLEFVLGFDQPRHLHDKSANQRKDWWEASKKLGPESLICLLGSDGTAIFFTVAREPRDTKAKDAELERMRGRLHKTYDLTSDGDRAFVIAGLVKKEDVPYLFRRVIGNKSARYSIVEFVGVLLPAFAPTLQSMQRMSTSLDLPFANIIAPTSTVGDHIDVPPPAYATRPGFTHDLLSLTDDETQIRLAPAKKIPDTVRELQAHTSLDVGQAEALASSLSRCIALIQGPPGTGKSHVGLQILRALLANKDAIKMGPILCVTFTNHALDQVLERCVDNGIDQIIRIGGRSKSERLAKLNLKLVAKEQDQTKTEKQDRWRHMRTIEAHAKEINHILVEFERLGQQSQVKEYLKANYPQHHEQLFQEEDDEGFQKVKYRKDNTIEDWLTEGMHIPGHARPIDVLQQANLHAMSQREREHLFGTWIADIKHVALNELKKALKIYETARTELDLIRTEVDLRVLRQAAIVGVTTSGLARNIDLLRRTKAKILVTEEAGEVLEAHLLTALLPSVEHAILIGDHQQLRPHVQNYELSAESRNGAQYALDISLFERLVQPTNILARPLPFSTLDVQRRMYPSISELVRRTIYPNLTDGPSVANYPLVSGLKHRLFWLDHEHPENEGGDAQSTSRTNDFECEMTAALVSHLVKQGTYNAGEIAVITPYLGQLRKIRNRLSATFEIVLNDRDEDDLEKEGEEDNEIKAANEPTPRTQVARGTLLSALRVATVDNFQGEEAKVIVVSLVRSNERDNPGFLKTSNRINVLLSRAQHGMYLIGNSRTMGNVKMWSDVLDIFKAGGLMGTSLELSCPRHPETPLSVSMPEDFIRVAPEAGCALTCDDRLPCGHRCVAKCHSELLHNAVYCLEPCTRPPRGCYIHTCPNPCGSACPPECTAMVNDIAIKPPNCDHEKTSLPCYQIRDPSRIRCDSKVTRTVKACGHEVEVECHVDVDSPAFMCDVACGSTLDECGHACRRPCYKCRKMDEGEEIVVNHGHCKQPCGRDYNTCSHSDRMPCHGKEPCPPCKQRCQSQCSHSTCSKYCWESCVPCAEPSCTTLGCTMPCAAPCNSLPPSSRCDKALPCGCQCPGVEGEACPDVTFCQTCGSEENLAQQADYIELKSYVEIDLDEEPCIFTACGHIFTITSLDGSMDIGKFYEVDPMTGDLVKTKRSMEPFSSDALKSCPDCRGSLRNIARYGRIVRRALLDESVKKLTVWANRRHSELSEHVVKEQGRLMGDLDSFKKPDQDVKLSGTFKNQISSVRSLRTATRYRPTWQLLQDVQRFANKLHKEEQPYQRIQDLVETARRRSAENSIERFEFDSSELQLRDYVQASSLVLRCEIILFSDVINAHHKTPETDSKGSLDVDFADNRKRCEILIQDSKAAFSVLQEAEGHVFSARFAALECGSVNYADTYSGAATAIEELKQAGFAHLDQADEACVRIGDASKELIEEIKEVRRMLDVGTSESEMRMIFKAMSREFFGTGHWYRCTNGHPFTVGECGMPMELARCGCGAGIGGENHRATEGVQHANDLETRFGRMDL